MNDLDSLHAMVSRALELADTMERHPIAAMLADVLSMIDRDSDTASSDRTTEVFPFV